jgi:hypothetical protein
MCDSVHHFKIMLQPISTGAHCCAICQFPRPQQDPQIAPTFGIFQNSHFVLDCFLWWRKIHSLAYNPIPLLHWTVSDSTCPITRMACWSHGTLPDMAAGQYDKADGYVMRHDCSTTTQLSSGPSSRPMIRRFSRTWFK